MFYHVLLITNMFRSLLLSPSSGWLCKGTKNTTNCQTISVEALSVIIESQTLTRGLTTPLWYTSLRNKQDVHYIQYTCVSLFSKTRFYLFLVIYKLTFCDHKESLRLYYNTECFHLYSSAVCCVLSTLVKPPWWWW